MDELVKMLRVCGDSNNSCGNCPILEDGSCPHGEWEFAAEKYMLQAADAIEELSHENESLAKSVNEASEILRKRWIPVTERLPEDFQKVLVFWREHSEPMIDTAFWQKDAKQFECEHWVRMEDKVTHWMPLPSTEGLNEA